MFENPTISIEELPAVDKIDFSPLEKEYQQYQFFNWIIRSIIYLLGATLFLLITGLFTDIVISLSAYSLIILFIIARGVVIYKGFPFKGYAIRTFDVTYKTGWLWKNLISVPFNRIQHVSMGQGFLEKGFNLAHIKVFTAGGDSSDLSIPGLRPEDATRLKEFITNKIKERE
ncbi:MAG: PH domain-containing protein [Bacteroidota bacterium]